MCLAKRPKARAFAGCVAVDHRSGLAPPIAQACDTDKTQARRVRSRGPVPTAVLDEPSPERHLPDRGAGDPTEAGELVGVGRCIHTARTPSTGRIVVLTAARRDERPARLP